MLDQIQKSLIRVKATDVSYKFDGTGRIVGMKFGLDINGKNVGFLLPVNMGKVAVVLKREGNTRHSDDDYVYRVSWACMRDWVIAQLTLLETEMAEPLQVFLPYAYDKNGKTLYESVLDSNLLLN